MCRRLAPLLLFILLASPARAADRDEELWAAAKKGDAAAVGALLEKGADVNARTAYGVTALGFAADKGHLEVVKVLLQHKADVNVKDNFYQATPLTWALMRNHAGIVKALVEAGAEGADAALRTAAATGNLDVVRAILETGKVKEPDLTKALAVVAARDGELAEMLKKAGAKPAAAAEEKLDREALNAFAGTYKSAEAAEVTVALQDGKLAYRLVPLAAVTLRSVDAVTFRSADDTTTVVFRREGDKVIGLTLKRGTQEDLYQRVAARTAPGTGAKIEDPGGKVTAPGNWPSFRGPGAAGVADGQFPPLVWDVEKKSHVRWQTPIPGLGHSCPVVWGDRVFVTTAVNSKGDARLRPGLYGDVDSLDETAEHSWHVLCLAKQTGKVLWDRTARKGVPRCKRHPKSTHANPTPATDGKHVIASFGSEGLYCYAPDGKLLWERDLGTLAPGWFYNADYQWGFGSSPVLYRDRVIVQCDVGKDSFIAAFDADSGKPLWQTPRDEIPSWGTPTVVEGPQGPELVTNASKFARGYDLETGKELWRLGRHAEITVPTPFAAGGLVFIASGYRPVQPIYAVRLGARGDLTLKGGKTSSDAVAWSVSKGGPYMPTPIVYGDYLYTCGNDGRVACYEAKTGKVIYRERLDGAGACSASPVAADGHLYFTSEENGVYVVKAGPKFELVAVNPLGDVCLATPAVAGGMLYVRTQHSLIGIGRTSPAKQGEP
jgi:outer membrane protein assembly factor BamB